MNATIGMPNLAAIFILRIALRYPSGWAQPKLQAVRSARVRPFWWPTNITFSSPRCARPVMMRPVIADGPVAVELDEAVEDQLQVVPRLGPVLVPRDPDGLPGVEVGEDRPLEVRASSRRIRRIESAECRGGLGARLLAWRRGLPSRRGGLPARRSAPRRGGDILWRWTWATGMRGSRRSALHGSRGCFAGAGSPWKIRILANRERNWWMSWGRSAGFFLIISRTRSANSLVTSLLKIGRRGRASSRMCLLSSSFSELARKGCRPQASS